MRGLALLLTMGSVCLQSGCALFSGENDESPGEQRQSSELVELHTNLGIRYLREGQNSRALRRLRQALEEDPSHTPAHNTIALVYERLGDKEKAEKHYVRAVTLNPKDSSAHTNYGRFLCTQGKYAEAERQFQAAIDNPFYQRKEVAFLNYGLCMKLAGDVRKAEDYLRRTLTVNPRLPVALLAMSEVELERGNQQIAKDYLKRYLVVAKHTPQSLWAGVRIERALGDRRTASNYASLLKSTYPDSRETRLLLDSGVQ